MPVFNVEAYLAECLESILGQDFADLEMVLVDDGSTDGSAAVAQRYASRHAHITLVGTANRGLGAARNLGVEHSRGELLTFVDSDDVVPPGAYSVQVATLDESGSDFVVGSMQRLTDGELQQPPFLRRLHRRRRLRLSINEQPEMISNLYAWNKVFRRSFWDHAGLTFPTRVRYEDQVTITEAYLRAEGFDVIRKPVYNWRVRADGSSITQRRYELGDLEERLATKHMTTELISTLGSPQVLDFWVSHGLGGDLPLYFRHIPGCSDEYWKLLVSGVRAIYAGYAPVYESQLLRVRHRLVGWLVTHDRRAEAETVVRWLEEHPGPMALQTRDAHVVAPLPWYDEPSSGIPEELFWLADHELTFDAQLRHVTCVRGELVLSGWAVVRGAPTAGVGCSIAVALRSTAGSELPMTVESRPAREVTQWVNREPQRYDEGAFVARVDTEALGRRSAGLDGPWQLVASVDVGGIGRSGGFKSKSASVALPMRTRCSSSLAVAMTFQPSAGLLVSVESDAQ